jgi:type IV pilus assembly protein PilC
MQEIDISQFKKQLDKGATKVKPLLKKEKIDLSALLSSEIRFPWQNQLKEKYKEAFYYEMGTLIQAGVDVKNSLDIISSSIKDKNYLQIITQLKENLIAGASFSDAMQQSKQFNEYEISCIRIGEETGRMEEIVVELSKFYGKKIKNKRKLISSLSYPIIVLTTAFGAVFFMLQVVVPMFADVFKQFGGQLPWLTQQVVKLSDLFKAYTIWILLSIALVYGVLFYFRKKEILRKIKSRLLLKMPIFGDLFHKIYLARFCSSMSLLVGNSVPLVRSISMVKNMISFYPFEQALKKVEQDIIDGKAFHQSLAQFDIFPNKLVQLIKVGEEVNQMGNLLKKVSEQYNEEVEFKVQTVSGMIEPLLIIFLGVIVGVILVAMYLPMFQISNSF